MKSVIKSKFFCGILSDGSVEVLVLPSYISKNLLYSKSVDTLNHVIWTGKRPKEQTDISVFVDRIKNIKTSSKVY